MKTVCRLGWIVLPLMLCVGCGGDDDGSTPPPAATDQEGLAAGWTAFATGDFAQAETEFRELLRRGALLDAAHDGLGWTFARESAPDSSVTHFTAALAAGADTAEIAGEVYAGLAFAQDAAGDPAACLAAAAEVPAGWVFAYDDAYTYDDVVLLRAVAHYALGEFAASLAAVQELDPAFDADVGTPEGRAALAARIEELLG